MKVINMLFVAGVSLLVLNGCMSTRHVLGKDDVDYEKASGGGRYSILQDHAPTGDIKVDHLPDLVPKWEAKSRGGNKSPYEVWGKKYWVMDSAQGYVAEGTASWYGKKFHGHKTSNGETYDMYGFSAAHKSLPLPTYLKVTNLDNQRSVIVRVNDRGPFHGDRLIDLSYAAAARLDYHKKGLARVRIEAITPARGQSYSPPKIVAKEPVTPPEALPAKVPSAPPVEKVSTSSELAFSHLQMGAFSSEESADKLKQRLFEAFDTSVKVVTNKQDDGLFKVLVGPFSDANELAQWRQKLQQEGFGNPVRVALVP
ncbi:septal ring lytic transglycosylase RlpA family protein [Marinomonas rhizomae]|uniref:Endolytic peptidoglycan transglycosylase RlpA n=1 Tax=Marinomonas rhizomae TaxID=491948 RepID=A0A366JAV3_9GAMM|nr:septal ring lytic transglycosylase RlpA family protein [Marinomonas rhizomae]RBP84166.1 rare lipoprotein A [Marinomonas rhizomae]RNF74496.1 septal ring lytic transglycosylase RlpA family protein [Marinomonas rhizomae]